MPARQITKLRTSPAHGSGAAAAPRMPEHIPAGEATLPRVEVVDSIVAFLRGLGLRIDFGPVPTGTFLPGIQMVANGLRVDPAALCYPGDLLHEGGHLALMTPERRTADFPAATDAAEEMATLAWSYAAALHLGVPPEIVFHQDGYKGSAESLITELRDNSMPLGVPFLAWLGLTTMPFPGSPSIFPRMLRWLREEPAAEAVEASEALPAITAARLPFRFDMARLKAEVAAIPENLWQPHFNQADFEGEWSSVALRSRSGAATDIVPLGAAQDFRNTPLLAASPGLQVALQHFDFPLKSVRLMRLHAGSEILEHRDRDLSLAAGELRLHIPIFTSDAVEFYLAGERVSLREGECWYLDFSQPHRIANRGAYPRVHLVIDGECNAWARGLLRRSAEETAAIS